MPQAAPVTSPIVHGMSMMGAFMAAVALAAAALEAAATSMLQGILAGTGLIAMPGGIVPALPPMGTGDDEIALGSTNVFWTMLGAGRVGDPTVHADNVAVGSLSVFVNSRPAARVGDLTVHGGVIIAGVSSVFIGGGTTAFGPILSPVNPQCAALAKAHDMALLSAHTYGKDANGNERPLPPGYRVLDPTTPEGQQELAELNVKPTDLQPKGSTFRAEIFARNGADGTKYVVGYRGTQTMQDWGNNLQQGTGFDSDEYKRALSLSHNVNVATGGTEEYTGHSLAGGMASAASVKTGRPATTFNAAGLNTHTVGGYPDSPAPVEAYYTQGEPLSALQDHRAGVLGGLTGGATLVDPALGGALGGFILGRQAAGQPVLPQAYGTRHALPRIPPPGAGIWQRNNVKDWHGMDYIVRGIEAQQEQLGCP